MKRLLLIGSLLISFAAAYAQRADVIVLCYHDVRNHVGGTPIGSPPKAGQPSEIAPGMDAHLDADQYAIGTRNLASHFDWLRAHGYHVIDLQQLIDARTGHKNLPDKAVLLTFDDGLRSAYTNVFPLLKAYRYHAVMAVVGAWIDLPANGTVDYGPRPFTPADFATWSELREMQDSGLVEIASHTYDLHRGILANPEGNLIPAVAVHAYNAQTRRYETDQEYAARIRADLARNSEEIREHLGRTPRAIMWPYGAYTQSSDAIASSLGMHVTFTLGWPVVSPAKPFGETGLNAIPRLVLMSNPNAEALAWSLGHLDLRSNIRAVQVDLDYIYDPDPAQQNRNLGLLLDRIKKLNVNQVWLQAFADPTGSGAASSVYFPNGELPMRADLFSRAAWQLRTRCGVQVYAWMPVLAWQLPDKSLQSRLQIKSKSGVPSESPVRLNPFLPESRRIIGALYEDLGRSAPVAGILFNDDAILQDTDDLGPHTPPPGTERTRALIDFTDDLTAHVRHWSPEISTARNLFAMPVLKPRSEAWYAQSLPAFLANYNMVALMAMPGLENVRRPKPWLKKLTRSVARVPGGIDGTVFELQTVDWRTKKPVPIRKLAGEMRLLQSRGALNMAYYPDDFAKNNPDIDKLIPAFSASNYPALQP